MSQFWEQQATALVEALKEHERHLSVDVDHFKNILLPYDLTWDIQSVYHPIIAENNKPQECGNISLFIDGIIYNTRMQQASKGLIPMHMQEHDPIPKKNILQRLLQRLSRNSTPYSVDEVLNNIKNNTDITSIMMSNPPTPYTLLGRFTFVDCNNPDGKASIYTGPVLVKPSISSKDEQKVYQWEQANTRVDKEKKYFGIFLL